MSSNKPVALVIDDDLMFQKAIRAVLEQFGFLPVITSDPEVFMSKAQTLEPALVLVDLYISADCVGFELIENFRRAVSRKTPVIVISGTREADAVSAALEAGASDFLTKNIDKSYLGLKLSRYVKTHELEEFESSAIEIPDYLGSTDLVLNGQVEFVDELGISFESVHFYPSRTAVRLSGNVIQEISGAQSPLLVTVVSNALDHSGAFYSTYAEFDPADTELKNRVRNWIVSKAGQPS